MKKLLCLIITFSAFFSFGCTAMPEKIQSLHSEVFSIAGEKVSIESDSIESDLTASTDNSGQNDFEESHSSLLEDGNQNNTSDEENKEEYTIKSVLTKGTSSNRRCIAYFTSWSAYARNVTVENIDPSKLTHINFAFANLSSEGEIIVGDSWVDIEKPFGSDTWETAKRGHFNQLNILKQKFPHVKTLISVGGWTWSGNFSSVASSENGRKKFALSAVDFITRYGFDGLDIDWEFPVEGGNDIAHLPEDKQNYTLLLKEVRKAFDEQGKKDNKHYLLTIAGGPNVTFTQNTELKEMMKYLDFINVMTYDYHGGWENETGHNSPIFADKDDTYSVQQTIDAYIKTGVEPQDLNLGLAFYGRGWINVTDSDNNGLGRAGTAPTGIGLGQGTWEGACFDYWDLEQNYINKNGYKRYWDDKAKVPYLYNGNSFITYDDAESIKVKLDFAESKGLGGVMYWEFSGDKNFTLQNVITDYYGSFGNSSSNGNNDNVVTSVSSEAQNNNSDNTNAQEIAATADGLSEWNSSQTYDNGDTVNYNGKTYRAKWWTQGETPSESEWGAWQLIS